MALIDPCVALPFDPKAASDNRDAEHNEEQPLTPTTPTSGDAASIAQTQNSAEPASQSSLSSQPFSNTSGPLSPSATTSTSYQPTNLPTVLQSVFSYIFNDHNVAANNGNTAAPRSSGPPHTPATATVHTSTTPSTLQPLSAPSTPIPNSQLLTPTLHIHPLTLTPSSHSSHPQYQPSSPSNTHKPAIPASVPTPSSRYCAILDLDETLLHSFFPDKVTPYQYQYMVMLAKQQSQSEANGLLASGERTLYEVDVGDGTIVVLQLRPFLREFLAELFTEYDVGVWSAGGKLYVDAICRVIFPHNGPHRPLFQLCWDDVQVLTTGMSSYTKPLTTLTQRYSHFSLAQLFLIDNRKENGLHFPSQLVQAPDYLPRPWEWAGNTDRDVYLSDDAMIDIRECVRMMAAEEEHEREIAFTERDDGSEDDRSQCMIDVSMRQDNDHDHDNDMDEEQDNDHDNDHDDEHDNNDSDDDVHTTTDAEEREDSASLSKRLRYHARAAH